MPQSKPIGLILLWGLYLALFYFIYKVINPFIYPILWAGIFTVIFSPLHKLMLKLTKNRETLSASLTMFLIIFLVIIPGAFLITLIVSESIDFAQNVMNDKTLDFYNLIENKAIQDIVNRITDNLNIQRIDIAVVFKEKLKEFSLFIISKAEAILVEIPSAFFSFFITLFTTFFMLRDGKSFSSLLKNLIPLSDTEIQYYFENLKKVIYITFLGVLLTAFAQGLIAFVAFYFIGIKSSLLLGVVTAVASLIPVVGSAIVWVPLAVFLLAKGLILKGVLVIIVGLLFISTVDNFVRPIFLHQYLSLHLLLTFFSLFGGIKAFGFIGIFLGPVIISAFIGCCLFYRDYRLKLQEEELKNETGTVF